MPTIYEVAKAQRELLLARDAALLGQVTRAYGVAYAAILRELKALVDAMAVAEKLGEPVNREWLSRRNRLETLQAQAARSISEFSQGADLSILNGQASAVQMAVEHSASLLETGLVSAAGSGSVAVGLTLNRVPDSALQHLVGFLSDGSPLSTVIGKLPPQAAMAVEDGLIEGLALGRSPRETARLMANAMATGGMLPPGGPSEVMERMRSIHMKALTIARTETLRSYRTAAHENYNANDDITEGWMWISAHQLRTCPVCWAMHGTIHPLTEIMASHPNCRCTQVPVLKEQYGGAPDDVRSGEEEFAKLTEAEQKFVLGPAKFQAFKAGSISLKSLVRETHSEQWGAGRAEASLKEALSGQKSLPLNRPARSFVARISGPRSLADELDLFRSAATEMDRLLEMPGKQIHVRPLSRDWYGMMGGRYGRHDFVAEIDRDGPSPLLTAAHELGHYLDLSGYLAADRDYLLGPHTRLPSGTSLYKAWVESRPGRMLERLKRSSSISPQRYEQAFSPAEVWARAFSMWLQRRATGAGWAEAAKMRIEFERQVDYMLHWTEKEFDAIDPLVTDVLREIGWLK